MEFLKKYIALIGEFSGLTMKTSWDKINQFKGDVYKQARFPFWSPFRHIWARIKSKTIFGIGILGSDGKVGLSATYFDIVHRGTNNRFFNPFSVIFSPILSH